MMKVTGPTVSLPSAAERVNAERATRMQIYSARRYPLASPKSNLKNKTTIVSQNKPMMMPPQISSSGKTSRRRVIKPARHMHNDRIEARSRKRAGEFCFIEWGPI